MIEKNIEELARLETLDNGKPLKDSLNEDLPLAIACYRYYAGWADKVQGKLSLSMVPTSAIPGTNQSGLSVKSFLGISPY